MGQGNGGNLAVFGGNCMAAHVRTYGVTHVRGYAYTYGVHVRTRTRTRTYTYTYGVHVRGQVYSRSIMQLIYPSIGEIRANNAPI
ncbi:hypothetical protein ANAEL_02384 [Anaerolineales bacterium]|nr:hypothetical protein ANAEL_02384 [Anaerolineales bacterium]